MDKMDLFHRITASPVFSCFFGFLALVGVAGPLLLLFAHFVALPSAAAYSLVHHSIGSLVWTGMGSVQTFSFLATGLFMEGFAAGLLLGIKGTRGFKPGIILLTFSGFSLILVGAFPTDIPYFPPTVGGVVHGIAAQATFVTLPLAMLLIAPSLGHNPYWKPLSIYSVATGMFAIIWIVMYELWLPKELAWFGLYERILTIVEIAWVEVMAMRLLPLSIGPVPKRLPAVPLGQEVARD